MTSTEKFILQNQARIMLALAFLLNGSTGEQRDEMIKKLMRDAANIAEGTYQ